MPLPPPPPNIFFCTYSSCACPTDFLYNYSFGFAKAVSPILAATITLSSSLGNGFKPLLPILEPMTFSLTTTLNLLEP